jgi:hypothetical protein
VLSEEVAAWLDGKLPEGWFDGPPEVEADNEEILVGGPLPPGPGAPEERAQRFRESSREQRVRIAKELERRFRRRVAWGVRIGAERYTFTTHSTPVMTRLRLPERRVLDTLVEAGVARSRSDALAWCVRLVGRHEREWIEELREALVKVGQVRKKDPSLR